jgi:hypothetical protein
LLASDLLSLSNAFFFAFKIFRQSMFNAADQRKLTNHAILPALAMLAGTNTLTAA